MSQHATTTLRKVLIANRGEIAVRIARTLRELGCSSVAVYSDVDERSRHVAAADESVALGGVVSSDTYLNTAKILAAAHDTGAEAIHPGYGFLSENADFAEAVIDSGLVWVGPPPPAARALGDKIAARRIAESSGVPVVVGTTEPVAGVAAIAEFGSTNGYPIAIKAAGGGGGRGLKVARSAEEIEEAFAAARREAQAYFGSRDLYLERYLEAPKHLEVQVLGLGAGDALWLGVRDCSMQRRHQKLIEESPPPRHAGRAQQMGEAAVTLAKATGYVGAGTVELLVEEDGSFYFLEVNARLQVEHTVTEEVLGIDLVACQLRIAAGEPLGLGQRDLEPRGHAIECRINAEDPRTGFSPSPGRITRLIEAQGLGVRVDSGYASGDDVPAAYDSLIAKLITRGGDRDEARHRMLRALDEMVVDGVATTIVALKALIESEEFHGGGYSTRTAEDSGVLSELATSSPETARDNVLLVHGSPVRLWNDAMSASAAAAVRAGTGSSELVAPMQGTILRVLAHEGQEVSAGDAVLVLEAMKMETTIAAPLGGLVKKLTVSTGDGVSAGQVLAVIE